jgi:LuxR family maltose regulon positive regulatory protein
LARLLVAEGDVAGALSLLDRVLRSARDAVREGSLVEGTLVRALAHHARHDVDAAAVDLATALELGVPAGYCRLFLDEGDEVLQLLGHVTRSATPQVRRHVSSLRASEPVAPTSGLGGGEILEPLSERELEVLHLLATELSGPEIARRLFVSVNTLRTHTKHIFTKLDVNTRRAAVRRGTELGLL